MKTLIVVCALALSIPTITLATPEKIVIPKVDTFKMYRGVTFDHKLHRESLRIACFTCHEDLNEPIKGFGKGWAHKVCKGCHDKLPKKAPTDECNWCHKLP